MASSARTDLAIIGAGPGGYSAAIRAADLGLNVTLIDSRPNPGGVCLYCGCVPSKALLHVAAFKHTVQTAAQWGIVTSEPRIDVDKVRSWRRSVIDHLTKGVGQLVRQRGITYVQGRAVFTDAHHVRITPVRGEETTQEFGHAIVATGSTSVVIPGTPSSPRIMNSQQALEVATLPERLLVVGGGYIGLELGQVYATFGSRVTMVEMTPHILANADRDLMRPLLQRLTQQVESLRTGTRVERLEETPDGIHAVFAGDHAGEASFDKVLIAVGRKPLTKDLGLEHTAARLTPKGFIEVDAQRSSAEPSIFAVGDAVGEPMLAHKAAHEGYVAAEAIAGKPSVFEPRAIPFVVFTDPEIAWCGLTEAEATRQGRNVKITSFPWAASGRAATVSRPDGLTKLLCEPGTGRILGAGIVGHGAGELLGEAVLAMEMGAVADDLAQTIHTHPTISETLMESAQAFSGISTHFKRN